MGSVYSDVNGLLSYAGGCETDPFVCKGLRRTFDKFSQNKKESLCKVMVLADSIHYPNTANI